MINRLKNYVLLGGIIALTLVDAVSAFVPEIVSVPNLTVVQGQRLSAADLDVSYQLVSTQPTVVRADSTGIIAQEMGRSYLLLPAGDDGFHPLLGEVVVLPNNDVELRDAALQLSRQGHFSKSSDYYEALSRKYPESQSYAIQSGLYRLFDLMESEAFTKLSHHWYRQMGTPLPLPLNQEDFKSALAVDDEKRLEQILMAPFGVLKESQVTLHQWVPYMNNYLVQEFNEITKLLDRSLDQPLTIVYGEGAYLLTPAMLKRLTSRLYFSQGLVQQRLAYDWSPMKESPLLSYTIDGYAHVSLKPNGAECLQQAYRSFVRSAELAPDSSGEEAFRLKSVIKGHVKLLAFPYYESLSERRVVVKGKSLNVSVDFKAFYENPPQHLGELLGVNPTYTKLFPHLQKEVLTDADRRSFSLIMSGPHIVEQLYTYLD